MSIDKFIENDDRRFYSLLGHSFGSRVTSVYINTDLAQVDAANRKVLDFVFGGGDMG